MAAGEPVALEDSSRSARKRRAILDAATEIFLRTGYLGTNMDEIAALSEVSKQTVYKHFSSKEALFVESAQFSGTTAYPLDVSRDERFLVFHAGSSNGYDLGVLPLTGERTPSAFLATPFNEVQGRFSPNSRWMAYASDESGRFEIYVRPFPAASGQTQVSLAGGMQPEWRGDGKELFYIATDGKLTAVPVTTDGPAFAAGTPHALFDVDVPETSAPYPGDYAVTADGQRFFVNTVVDQPTRPALTVILNWAPEREQ